MSKWHMTIPSDPDKIADVGEFLEKIFAETGWDEDIQANIGIAVTEIVNNAILHGNKSIHDKEVDITVVYEGNLIRCRVKDQSDSSEQFDVLDPTTPENLMRTNGRGLFIVQSMTDELTIENGEEGTTVCMKYYINK